MDLGASGSGERGDEHVARRVMRRKLTALGLSMQLAAVFLVPAALWIALDAAILGPERYARPVGGFVAALASIGLFVCGWSFHRGWACSNCGNFVPSNLVRICRDCGAKLD